MTRDRIQQRHQAPDYDAVIVGGSLAGCTTAIFLGRAGRARRPGREAARPATPSSASARTSSRPRRCRRSNASGCSSRSSQPAACAPGSRPGRAWGWIEAAARGGRPRASTCAARSSTRWSARRRRRRPGVDLHARPGRDGLLRERRGRRRRHRPRPRRQRGRPCGQARDRRRRPRLAGRRARRGEGEDSPARALRLRRLLRGALPEDAPDSAIWFIDPHWAAAFPTDSGLVFYAAMPTKELLPEFKRDPTEALIVFMAGLPEAAADPRGRGWSNRCSAKST